jgi:hypothetical protein
MPYYDIGPARPRGQGAVGEGGVQLGAAVGALGAMLLAFAMVPFRDTLSTADVALVLVLPVLLGAVIGGRIAGITGAAVAALSFNFAFTQPYGSLRIADRDDVVTFIMLAVIGVIVAELGSYGRRQRITARRARSELDRVYRVADLSAQGAEIDDVVASVRAELIGLFGLVDCVYEPAAGGGDLPRLGHGGALEHAQLVAADEFLLPTGGVEVPVNGRGRAFGRLVLFTPEPTPAPLDKRLVAVTIAHELGATFASRSSV